MSEKPEIYVCTNLRLSGTSCSGQGAANVLKALRLEAAVANGSVVVSESVCMGYCGEGPNVKILGGAFHHGVTPAAVEDLVREALEQSVKKDASKA